MVSMLRSFVWRRGPLRPGRELVACCGVRPGVAAGAPPRPHAALFPATAAVVGLPQTAHAPLVTHGTTTKNQKPTPAASIRTSRTIKLRRFLFLYSLDWRGFILFSLSVNSRFENDNTALCIDTFDWNSTWLFVETATSLRRNQNRCTPVDSNGIRFFSRIPLIDGVSRCSHFHPILGLKMYSLSILLIWTYSRYSFIYRHF